MGYSLRRDALLVMPMAWEDHPGRGRRESPANHGDAFQQEATPCVKKPERFLEETFMQARTEAIHALHPPTQPFRKIRARPSSPAWFSTTARSGPTAATRACTGCAAARSWRARATIRTSIPDRERAGRRQRARHPPGPQQAVSTAWARRRRRRSSCRAAPAWSRATSCCCAPTACGRVLPDTELAQPPVTRTTVVQAVPDMVGDGHRHRRQPRRQHDRPRHPCGRALARRGHRRRPTSLDADAARGRGHDHACDDPRPAPGPGRAFDEDDIEKAIAEIRGAIEKSSADMK